MLSTTSSYQDVLLFSVSHLHAVFSFWCILMYIFSVNILLGWAFIFQKKVMWLCLTHCVMSSCFVWFSSPQVDVFAYGIILCEVIARVQADPDFLPRTAVCMVMCSSLSFSPLHHLLITEHMRTVSVSSSPHLFPSGYIIDHRKRAALLFAVPQSKH